MASMESYSKAAMERAMKVQEVILRAMAKKITWWQAAEIIGISDRQMRRWRERLTECAIRRRSPLVGRLVAYASLCRTPRDAFRQESGTAVFRQLDAVA